MRLYWLGRALATWRPDENWSLAGSSNGTWTSTCGCEVKTTSALLRAWFRNLHPGELRLQRTLRAIRRNRRRVPPLAELRRVFASHTPAWIDERLLEAAILLELGPKARFGRKTFPLTWDRCRGRPRKRAIPVEVLSIARECLATLIVAHRDDDLNRRHRRSRHRNVTREQLKALFGCGIVVTPRPQLAIRLLSPDGEARLTEVEEPVRGSSGPTALWFALPWQRQLFWRAVGLDEPALRNFAPRPHSPGRDAAPPRVRADRAARDLLLAVIHRAGVRWRPREHQRATRAIREHEALHHARAFLAAEKEIGRRRRDGREVPEAMYRTLFNELGG